MKTANSREQLLDLPQELKAYIYQQIQDFAPFCLPDSGVKVFVEKEAAEGNESDKYFVTMVLTGDGAELKSEAEGRDIYEAARKAKKLLLEYLQQLQSEMLSEMLDEEVESLEEPMPLKKVVH